MEQWYFNAARTEASVTQRVRVSLLKKINPVWWFKNDTEQTLAQASWYHPEWPQWRRWLTWNVFRNPMQNFRCFVVGVQDKNYLVTGRAPVGTVQRNDIGETGWQWCVLHGGDIWLRRGFVSYSGKHVTWYVGWQISGFFGVKFVLE